MFFTSLVLVNILTGFILGNPIGMSMNLLQDQMCGGDGSEGWRCTSLAECASEVQLQTELKRCSRQNGTDFFCCPTNRTARTSQINKAVHYCEVHTRRCKNTSKWNKNTIVSWKQSGNALQDGVRSVSTKKYLHMVKIGYGDQRIWSCAGSLISERFVVTTAQCAQDPVLGPAKWARIGEFSKKRKGAADYSIVELIIHPNYKQPALYHNVALLKLERDVIFNDQVQPLCLHSVSKVAYGEATATCWGKEAGKESEKKLLEMESPMIHASRCNSLRRKDIYTPQGIKKESMICAGTVGTLGDSCQAFNGGPLVIKKPSSCLYSLVGVASFRDLCKEPFSPAVYTRISSYVPWIESVVWK